MCSVGSDFMAFLTARHSMTPGPDSQVSLSWIVVNACVVFVLFSTVLKNQLPLLPGGNNSEGTASAARSCPSALRLAAAPSAAL